MAVSDLESSFIMARSLRVNLKLVGGMMLQPIQPLTQMSRSELIAVSVCFRTTSISLPSQSTSTQPAALCLKQFECPPGIPNLLLLEGSLPPGGSFCPALVSTNPLASTFKIPHWFPPTIWLPPSSQSSSSSNLRVLLPPGNSFHQTSRKLLSTEPHRLT